MGVALAAPFRLVVYNVIRPTAKRIRKDTQMHLDVKSLSACYSLLELGPAELCRRCGKDAKGKPIYSERNWGETLRGLRWPAQKIDFIAERLEVHPMDLLSAICQYRKESKKVVDEKRVDSLD